MPFSPPSPVKDWQNGATPINDVGLEDLEARTRAHAEAVALYYARKPRGLRAGKIAIGGRNVAQRPNLTAALAFTHHKSFKVFTAATDLIFRFTHYNASAIKEAKAAGALTIRASVRVNGQNHEITRNGNTDIAITSGYVDSDPVAVEVAAGTTIIVNTYLVSGTLPYSTGFSDGAGTSGDTYTNGDATGPAAAVGTGTSASLYGPSLIVGTPQAGATVKPVVGIVGDSISRGFNDTASYGADGGGFIVRALEAANLPWVMASRFTSATVDWEDIYGRKIRVTSLADCDYLVFGVGVNDFNSAGRTALQVETSVINVARDLGLRRGIPVYPCTVTPVASSTDSFVTVANQTPMANNAARVAYNDWLRGGSPVDNATSLTPVAVGTGGALLAGQTGHPIKGYFEVADTVESARNSGKWKVDGNPFTYVQADGLHPITAGHIAMSAAITVGVFV